MKAKIVSFSLFIAFLYLAQPLYLNTAATDEISGRGLEVSGSSAVAQEIQTLRGYIASTGIFTTAQKHELAKKLAALIVRAQLQARQQDIARQQALMAKRKDTQIQIRSLLQTAEQVIEEIKKYSPVGAYQESTRNLQAMQQTAVQTAQTIAQLEEIQNSVQEHLKRLFQLLNEVSREPEEPTSSTASAGTTCIVTPAAEPPSAPPADAGAASGAGSSTMSAAERTALIDQELTKAGIAPADRAALKSSIELNVGEHPTTGQVFEAMQFLIPAYLTEKRNKGATVITEPITAEMCTLSTFLIDVSPRVKRQSGATCAYHAVWNAAQIFSYLKNRENLEAANKQLAEGPDIALLKEVLTQRERDIENLDDADVEYLAKELQGLNKKDFTIISTISQFTPELDKTFWQTIRDLQTKPGFTHMFIVSTARQIEQEGQERGASGHWVAIVAQNEDGKINLHVADSAYNQDTFEFANKTIIERTQQWIHTPWQIVRTLTNLRNKITDARKNINTGNLEEAITKLQTLLTEIRENKTKTNVLYVEAFKQQIVALLEAIVPSIPVFVSSVANQERLSVQAQRLLAAFRAD